MEEPARPSGRVEADPDELNFTSEPSSNRYEIVVLGGGVGGLSTAAFLASQGRQVLVVDRQEEVGGYAHAFRRGPYTFDPAVHVYPDAEPDALPMSLYRFLGVADMLDFRQTFPYYRAFTPTGEITAPVGLENFIAEHQRLFPDERDGIDAYFRLVVDLHHQAHVLPPALGFQRLDAAKREFPALFKYARQTVSTAIKDYLRNPALQSIASSMWPYIGTPPHRASIVTLATHISVLVDGSYYPAGSAQTTSDALATAIVRHGGEIVVKRTPEKITLSDGRATGVVLDDGQAIAADVVVGAIAAPMIFEQLIGLDKLPTGFVARHRRMKLASSAVLAYVSTKLDLEGLGAAHENFLTVHEDHEDSWNDIMRGQPGGMWMTVPTIVDPSLAPEGEHAITITSVARYDAPSGWSTDLDGFVDSMLAAFDQRFPGLKDSANIVEVATPPTLERFTGNPGGAAYGWDNTPHQTGGRRSPHVVPGIDGLFLAGHWTQPGSGTIRCLVSGYHAASLILAHLGADPIPFQHEMMPPPE